MNWIFQWASQYVVCLLKLIINNINIFEVKWEKLNILVLTVHLILKVNCDIAVNFFQAALQLSVCIVFSLKRSQTLLLLFILLRIHVQLLVSRGWLTDCLAGRLIGPNFGIFSIIWAQRNLHHISATLISKYWREENPYRSTSTCEMDMFLLCTLTLLLIFSG